jgi:hypothetical protein
VSAAPLLDDDPTQNWPRSAELSPYAVVLRSNRRPGDASVIATELIESLADRLSVALTFDDLGYEAEFSIVAENDLDAVSTARRRWFYLATDLELPSWPITDVNVTPQSRTHATWW